MPKGLHKQLRRTMTTDTDLWLDESRTPVKSCKDVKHNARFYARQLYRQVQLRARISYENSVCPSVYPSRHGTDSRPGEIETPGFHHMIDSLLSSFLWGTLVTLQVRRFPSNESIKEGYPLPP